MLPAISGTLPAFAVVLALTAAVLHAAWNTLLRGGDDRLRIMMIMAAAAGLAALPLALVLPFPARAAWPSLLLSIVLHVGYSLFLIRAYRFGELGLVYPVARGLSPLLVTLGAAVLAGEWPGWVGFAGIVLVSGGILSLARGLRGADRQALRAAGATGLFIAAYTVSDGLGARLSGGAHGSLAYAAWLFVLEGLAMVATGLGLGATPVLPRVAAAQAALGGVVSLIAYAMVIIAAANAPMGAVSALRETSVVAAALFGRCFLAERLTLRRFGACCAVAAGAVWLGLAD